MHCPSVCALLVAFGNCLGLQGAELKSVGKGGLLHEIGKTLVAQEILNKPGQLAEVEFTAMKRHSDLGHTLLLANRVSTIGVIPSGKGSAWGRTARPAGAYPGVSADPMARQLRTGNGNGRRHEDTSMRPARPLSDAGPAMKGAARADSWFAGLVLLAAAAAAAPSAAQPASATHRVAASTITASDADADAVQVVMGAFEREFTLPDKPPLREDLATTARAITDEHLQRLRAQVQQWPAQARATAPAGRVLSSSELNTAFLYRFYNEMMAWRLAAGAPDSGSVTALAEFVPLVACRHADNVSRWAELLQQLQALPPERQAAALGAEGALLQSWGHWPAPAPVPETSLEAMTRPLLADLSRAPADRAPTMLPVLASVQLRDKPLYTRSSLRCAGRLWQLQAALAAGRARDEVLAAHAYATAPKLADRVAGEDNQAKGENGYPLLAQSYSVEGLVTVEIQSDARGRLLAARVVGRQLRALEQTGSRPLAFETLLDTASIERAKQLPLQVPEPGKLKDGVARRRVEFQWSLQ